GRIFGCCRCADRQVRHLPGRPPMIVATGKTAFFALGLACSLHVIFGQDWPGHTVYGIVCAALCGWGVLVSIDEWPTESAGPQRIVHHDGTVDHVYHYDGGRSKVIIENAEEDA